MHDFRAPRNRRTCAGRASKPSGSLSTSSSRAGLLGYCRYPCGGRTSCLGGGLQEENEFSYGYHLNRVRRRGFLMLGTGWRRIGNVVCLMLVLTSLTIAGFPNRAIAQSPEWGVQKHYPLPMRLYGVSCPTTSDCWAVGGTDGYGPATVFATSDGGISWTPQSVPSDIGVLDGISCPTTSNCWAVGDGDTSLPTVIATTNGGGTWVEQSLPSNFYIVRALDCPTTSDCFAGCG